MIDPASPMIVLPVKNVAFHMNQQAFRGQRHSGPCKMTLPAKNMASHTQSDIPTTQSDIPTTQSDVIRKKAHLFIRKATFYTSVDGIDLLFGESSLLPCIFSNSRHPQSAKTLDNQSYAM